MLCIENSYCTVPIQMTYLHGNRCYYYTKIYGYFELKFNAFVGEKNNCVDQQTRVNSVCAFSVIVYI